MPDSKKIHTNYDFDGDATVTGLKEPVEPTDAVRLQDIDGMVKIVQMDGGTGNTIYAGEDDPVDNGYTPVDGDIWIPA